MKCIKIIILIGAIIGDIVGSVYEWNNIKTKGFPLISSESTYTDDTVLTIAVADAIINYKDFGHAIYEWGNKYKNVQYGDSFRNWLNLEIPIPYNSWGNGSAMRVSPVGFMYNDLEKVLDISKQTAEVTHNHPEGIKGAQAIASAIFLARNNKSKNEIKKYIETNFNYNLSRKIINIRPTYTFYASCMGSVPEAIISFLESNNFEDAIRIAVSLGGDSDTIACIAGGIAQAFYKHIDEDLLDVVNKILPKEMNVIINNFNNNIGGIFF